MRDAQVASGRSSHPGTASPAAPAPSRLPTPLRLLHALTTRRQRHLARASSMADLVRGTAAGSREHHGELCRRVHETLLPYARHLTRDSGDAEDLLQDVYAALPRHLQRYDERGQFVAYLRELVFNRWRTRARSARRRPEETLDPIGDVFASPGTTITGEVAQRDLVDRALRDMPSAPREAWVLYSDGVPPAEIAARLGISYEAANTRLTRARKHLKERLRYLI